MNKDIAILRDSIGKLTQMLAGMGLRVTQMGAKAFVKNDMRTNKPVQVNIPNLPDNADDSLILAIQGFIDHEVAHILFTDFKVHHEIEKRAKAIVAKRKTSLADERERLRSLWNILEDTFIERKIGQKFPGSHWNLDLLHEHFLAKVTEPALKQVKGDPNDEFSILMVPIARAWSGQKRFQEWCDRTGAWDHPLVKHLIKSLPKGAVEKVAKIANSHEALDLAGKFFEVLFPDQATPPSPAPKPAPQPPEKGEQGQSEQGKGETSEEKQNGKGSNTSKPEDDEDQGSGGEEQSDDELPDEDQESSGPSAPEKDVDADADEDDGEGSPEEAAADAGAETPADEPEDDDSEDQGGDAADEPDQDAPAEDAGDAETGSDDPEDGADEAEDGSGGEEGDDSEDEGSAAADGDEGDEDQGEVGPSGDSDDDAKDDADSSARNGSDEDEGSEATGSAKPTSDGEEQDKEAPPPSSPESSPFFVTPVDLSKSDFEGAIEKIITDAATRDTRGADYIVYTREWDRIEPFEVCKDYKDHWLTDLDDRTRHMVGPMQKEIERMMAARSQVVRVGGFRSGRLKSSALHRLAANDDRVFDRKRDNRSLATAVSLVVDNSGSMEGSPMDMAMAAAYALSQTLERVTIKHEVSGFTTTGTARHGFLGSNKLPADFDINAIHVEASRLGRMFSRVEPIYMPIYKGYDERLTSEVKRRFAAASPQHGTFGRSNIDGESVQLAVNRILQRTEPRKVVIVLSDGFPATHPGNHAEICSHLHKVVADAGKAGIEMIGIGIMSEAVRQFYPKALVLQELEELPKSVMGELKRILLAA